MKIYSLALLLSLVFAASSEAETSIIRRRLQEGGEDSSSSEAPSPALFESFDTPPPTVSGFDGGEPTVGVPTDGIPTIDEGSEFGGSPVDETPTNMDGFGGDNETPAPGDSEGTPTADFDYETLDPAESTYTDSPVEAPTTGDYETPVAAPPTYKPRPTTPEYYETPAPSPRPEAAYVPNDDDPLQPVNPDINGDEASWGWQDSSVEEVEHDRTVLIALSVTFAFGILLSIITAHQTLQNPGGCCARYVHPTVPYTTGCTQLAFSSSHSHTYWPSCCTFFCFLFYSSPQHLPYLCRLYVCDYALRKLSLPCHMLLYQ